MTSPRRCFTPLTLGAFALVATTGELMFFHLANGPSTWAHAWASWLLLIGVAGHVWANGALLKRYAAMPWARAVVGLLLSLTLLLSLAPLRTANTPAPAPFAGPLAALATAPLPVLAQVAGVSPEQMQDRLARQGVTVTSDASTIAQSVGDDAQRQLVVLSAVLAAVSPPQAGGSK